MSKRRMPVLTLCLLLLCIILAGVAGTYAYKRFMPTNEKADLGKLYGVSGDEVALLFNYEKQAVKGIDQNGRIYLPISWVNDNLNERFYWDANEKKLVYALPEKIVYADAETVGAGGQKLLLDTADGVYLDLGLVLNYTDIRVSAYDKSQYKRVFVENSWAPIKTAVVKRNGKLRLKGGVKSPVITEVVKGESVTVLEQMKKWTEVMTEDGHIGYMASDKLKDLREETPKSTFKAPVYKNISLDEKITMVWHQVTIPAANGALDELLSTTRGVNVIAPTWFTLSDNNGNYESLASKDYVKKAHAKGIQVWAVVDNFSKDVTKNVQSEILLSKTSARQKLIKSLMKEADTYGFDGFNLDFESLKTEAGVHYIEFIRELSVACRKKGLVLSVDNYVPTASSGYYNREEQGIVADYVVIMGYDEHYPGGAPGSVSSLGYVENGIRDTLAAVPKEKVINGVPFYTRLWTENQKSGKVTSKSMGLSAARKWVADNQVKLEWQDAVGQYYGEVQSSDTKSFLWMEDAKSLGLKMNLIKKYQLAGVAGWRLGLETPDIWDSIGWGSGTAGAGTKGSGSASKAAQ